MCLDCKGQAKGQRGEKKTVLHLFYFEKELGGRDMQNNLHKPGYNLNYTLVLSNKDGFMFLKSTSLGPAR